MSLPWSKVLRLQVDPLRVGASLHRRWPSGEALAWSRVELPPADAAATAPEDTHTQTARRLAAGIDAALSDIGRTHALSRVALEVDVADALFHFDVASGAFAGDSDRQLDQVANACVTEILGNTAAAHEVRWQLQADGRHLLIAALRKDLLTAILDVARSHGLRLDSLEPDFCRQWNQHAATLREGQAIFAVAGPSSALVACVDQGAVSSLARSSMAEDRSGTAGRHRLDARVDGMLATLGRQPGQQAGFVLVTPSSSRPQVSSRWTVLRREARAA